MLPARHDDDDIYIYVYIYIYLTNSSTIGLTKFCAKNVIFDIITTICYGYMKDIKLMFLILLLCHNVRSGCSKYGSRGKTFSLDINNLVIDRTVFLEGRILRL